MDAAATSSSHAPPAVAAGSSAPTPSTNIWDSAWSACTQTAPPNLTEILGAYAQKGDGDREMLLGILKAKSAEDQRIAAVASLHQTILQLQAGALQQGVGGLNTPTATPPVQSPPAHRRPSIPAAASYSPPLPSNHSYPAHHPPQMPPPSGPSSFALPPISTIRTSSPPPESRKRSRVSSQDSAEYPLSPYSTGSGRSPHQHYQHQPRSAAYPPPPPSSAHHNGRLAVSSLVGPGDEDGDVKYRRMSAERSTRSR